MKFQNVDLEEELIKLNKKQVNKNSIMELKLILHQAYEEDIAIRQRVLSPAVPQDISFEGLDENRIFNLEQIRGICLKYRLRFLDASLFKGEIPAEAISKIKHLEKELGKEFKDYKIIAPKSMFTLKEKDSDPLLFVRLNDNCFYFIHKWGGELNRFRRIIAYPMQSFGHYLGFLIGLSFIFMLLIPTSHIGYSLFLFMHFLIAFACLSSIYIFGINRQNFTSVVWDSQYIA